MTTVFITGANRGLGLEFTRQYLAEGNRVIAACRNPEKAEALQALESGDGESPAILEMDVTSDQSIREAFAATSRDFPFIDLLINNAGIATWTPFDQLRRDEMETVLATNTVSPVMVTQCFLPLLRKGGRKLIVNITSGLGSIALREAMGGTGSLHYNASKTALNMIGKMLAMELVKEGITVILQSPGWVRTDMGTEAAELDPAEAVAGMRRNLDRVQLRDSGKFFEWNGEELPW